MSNQNYIFKMALLMELLQKRKRGNAEVLAKKLNVSRRTLYRYLEELRDLGAEIDFCKDTNRYVLKGDFDFIKVVFKDAV